METLRHFFRCHDCLSVFSIEKAEYSCREIDRWETPEGKKIVCPCGGSIHYMGPVTRHPVYDYTERSACDGRCTEAKGNSCDCICGGVNHGSGRTVTVAIRQDIEAPDIKGIDYKYGDACRARRAAIRAPISEELEMMKRGQFIHDKSRWRKANQARDFLREAYWSFTKASREKLFRRAEEVVGQR